MRFFGRTPKESDGPSPVNQDFALPESVKRALEERRETDPLIGAKFGAKEINTRLTNALRTASGVHIETVLHILGSLAGYACQASVRAQATEQGFAEEAFFVVVEGPDNGRLFFGDPLNKPLAEAPVSVWGLVVGAAQHVGCTKLPDTDHIFSHVARTIGGDQFGVPRIPDPHRISEKPIAFLKVLWPQMFPIARAFCATPVEWPILFGLAIQEVIVDGKTVLDPCMAAQIVLECAVPMSKVDLAAL